MNKVIVAAVLATAGLCTGVAHAGNVSWSIGINTPVIGTVLSNGPVYAAPVYATPVYVEAPRLVPMPVYVPAYGPGYAVGPGPATYPRGSYRPFPVVYAGGGHGYEWQRHWHRDERRFEPRSGHEDRGDRHHAGHD